MDAALTPTPTLTRIKYFLAGAPLKLRDGINVLVQNLQPGDGVDVGGGVYMTSDMNGAVETQFVQAHFEDGENLTESADHYIPTHDGGVAVMTNRNSALDWFEIRAFCA